MTPLFEENVKCQLDRQTEEGGRRQSRVRDARLLPRLLFLRCTGYDLIDLRAEGRRKVFVFRDRPDAPQRRAGFLPTKKQTT